MGLAQWQHLMTDVPRTEVPSEPAGLDCEALGILANRGAQRGASVGLQVDDVGQRHRVEAVGGRRGREGAEDYPGDGMGRALVVRGRHRLASLQAGHA